MHLTNLDPETRHHMRQEAEQDIQDGALYLSPRLSPRGRLDYPELLLLAVDSGTPDTLAAAIAQNDRLNETETAVRNGNPYVKRVPVNAPETMAEGEFNRFYARGLCRRAIAAGINEVRVYRAKEVTNPRPASEAMIGRLIDAQALLDDLRTSIGVDTALQLPPGPNSGLSIELGVST